MSGEIDIIVRLQDDASTSLRAVTSNLDEMGGGVNRLLTSFSDLALAGTFLTGILGALGGAALSAFQDSIKAGMEFESAFTGVAKTVEGVALASGELTEVGQRIREEFRQLALEIPLTAAEISKIGEVGGQLGVDAEGITAFTKTMAALGVTTTLTAENAAFEMAKLGNVLGLTSDEIDRSASSLVELGNNFATTETDIMSMSVRFSGAAESAGMTADQVLAIAAAFASVGVTAEVGGTAISKVIMRIDQAVAMGSDKVERFAEIAGMSAQEFSAAWDGDAGAAFTKFVEGLGKDTSMAYTYLQELELSDMRLVGAFMRVASAGDLLSNAMERSSKAFAENIALSREAGIRYATVESQLQLFKNTVTDLQISLFDALRPAIVSVLTALSGFVVGIGPAFVNWLQGVSLAIMAFTQSLIDGAGRFDSFIVLLRAMGEAVGLSGAAIDRMVSIITFLAEAFDRVIAPIATAIAQFLDWRDIALAAALAIGVSVGALAVFILGVFGPVVILFAKLALLFTVVRQAWENDIGGIKTAITGAVETLGNFVNALQTMKSFISGGTGVDELERAIQGLPASLQLAVVAFGRFLSDLSAGSSVIDSLRAAFPLLGQAASMAMAEIGASVTAGFANLWASIQPALASVQQNIFNWAGTENWVGVGLKIIQTIADGARQFGSWWADVFAAIFNFITNWVNSVDWSQVGKTLVMYLAAAIVSVVGLLWTGLVAIYESIVGFFENADMGDAAESLVEALGNAIADFADGVGEGLEEIGQAILDWAGAEDWEEVGQMIVDRIGEALGDAADAIAEQLEEWREAIFDWADAEDWEGVAQHIAEMIGEKLGELGDAISAQLGEWQQAIFDWADAEDWEGVAQHIADMIGEKLGELGDSISAQLGEWQQAIFDWADAEDWGGVADHIATMIGEKLGEASESVSSTLSSWYQAILDWAGAEGWGEVAAKIAEIIGDWLEDAGDAVAAKLSSWITAFTTWVESVDWYQVGYDIMYNITEAFLDFKDMLNEKIGGWVESFSAETEGLPWYEVAYKIIEKILEFIGGTAEQWATAVGGWITALSSAVGGQLQNLMQVGRDLVAGIAAGIGAAVDLIQGAVAGATAAAEPAARAAAQSHSPSRLMMPVGYDLSAGIAVGITQGAGTIISAIQAAASQAELEAVKAFSETVKAIGEAIQSAVYSYVLLTGFSGANTAGAARGLDSIALLMNDMVSVFSEANEHGTVVLEEVSAFVDTADKIVGLIADSMLPLMLLASMDMSFLSSSRLAAGLSLLRDFLIAAVAGFIEAAAELGVMGTLVTAFAEAAESVIGLVEDGLKAVALLAGFNFGPAVANWHLRDQIVIFRNIVQTMVREFAESALELTFMAEAVGVFTEAAEGVIGLVEDGLKAVMLLSGFNFAAAVDGWHLRDQIVIFRNIVQTMVREFMESALSLGFMGEAVEAFTDAAEGVIGLVEDGLKAVMLLSGFNFAAAVDGWHLRDQIVIFRNIIRTMIREFAEAAGEFGAMSESVEDFADAAEGVIGIVEDGLAASMALSSIDFGPVVDGWHLRDQIVIFRNIIRTMVREFAEAAAEFGSMSESVEDFADAAEGTLGLVEDGIAAVTLLSETDFGPIVSGWHLHDQIVIFRNIIRTLIREFTEAATEFGSMAEAVGDFADAADSVVGLVANGIEVIGLLASYDFGSEINSAIEKMAEDLTKLVGDMLDAFENAGLLANQALLAGEDAFGAIGDVLDVVKDGVDALVDIAGYVSLGTAAGSISSFANDLVRVVTDIVDALNSAGALSSAAVQAASAMSDGLKSILDLVKPGIEAVVLLIGYVSNGAMVSQTTSFARDLIAIVNTLANALVSATGISGSAVAAAAEFSDDIGAVLDVVKPALDPNSGAFGMIAGFVSDGQIAAKTQKFGQDLVAVTKVLVDALTQSALATGQALAKAGVMAESVKDLYEAINKSMIVIEKIGDYAGGDLKVKAEEFARDIVDMTLIIVNGLSNASNNLGVPAIAAAQALATAITSIVLNLADAVRGLNDISKFETIDIEPQFRYIEASARTIVASLSRAHIIERGIESAIILATAISEIVRLMLNVIAGLEAIGRFAMIDITEQMNYIHSSMVYIMQKLKAAEVIREGIVAAQTMAAAMIAIAAAMAEVMANLNSIAAYDTPDIQSIIDYILKVAQMLGGTIPPAAQEAAKAVASSQHLQQSLLSISASLVAGIGFINQIHSTPVPSIDGAMNGISAAVSAISGAMSGTGVLVQANTFARSFSDNMSSIASEVAEAARMIGVLAGTGVSGSVQDALNRVAASLKNTEGQFRSTGETLGKAMVDSLQGAVNAGSGLVVSAALSVLNNARTAAAGAATSFNQVGVGLVQNLNSGMMSQSFSAAAAATSVVSSAARAASAAAREAFAAGQNFGRDLEAGIRSMANGVEAAGLLIGNAMVNGMVRALDAGRSRVIAASTTLATNAIKSAQSELGIASPSKAFSWLGEMSVEGFRRPFETDRSIESTISRVIGNAVSGASGVVGFGAPSFVGGSALSPTRTYNGPGGFPGSAAGAAPVNITINIDTDRKSIGEVETAVRKAVRNALDEEGRSSESRYRTR